MIMNLCYNCNKTMDQNEFEEKLGICDNCFETMPMNVILQKWPTEKQKNKGE